MHIFVFVIRHIMYALGAQNCTDIDNSGEYVRIFKHGVVTPLVQSITGKMVNYGFCSREIAEKAANRYKKQGNKINWNKKCPRWKYG